VMSGAKYYLRPAWKLWVTENVVAGCHPHILFCDHRVVVVVFEILVCSYLGRGGQENILFEAANEVYHILNGLETPISPALQVVVSVWSPQNNPVLAYCQLDFVADHRKVTLIFFLAAETLDVRHVLERIF